MRPDRLLPPVHQRSTLASFGSGEPSSRVSMSAAFSSVALLIGLRLLNPDRSNRKAVELKKKEIAKRIGRPIVQTNEYEAVIACDVIDHDHIDVTFESIGGLENIKQSLFDLVILPQQRPELFSHCKLLRPQNEILLYGLPGIGKTMLAKTIARESGAVFINVMISNLMSKWFGDSQKLVAAVFSLAYKLQPAIIFVDEVDTFWGSAVLQIMKAWPTWKPSLCHCGMVSPLICPILLSDCTRPVSS